MVARKCFGRKWFSETTIKNLESKNYKIERVNQIGRTEMILVKADGTIIGLADGRGDDSVAAE